MKGTSSPIARAAAATSSSSVETTRRSMTPLVRAASAAQASRERSPSWRMFFFVRRVWPPLAGIRLWPFAGLRRSDAMASFLGKEPPVAVVAGVQHLTEEAVVQDPQARMALQVVAPEVALEEIALHAVILHCLRLMREVFDAEDIAARHADDLVDHAAEVVRRHVDQHARGEIQVDGSVAGGKGDRKSVV